MSQQNFPDKKRLLRESDHLTRAPRQERAKSGIKLTPIRKRRRG